MPACHPVGSRHVHSTPVRRPRLLGPDRLSAETSRHADRASFWHPRRVHRIAGGGGVRGFSPFHDPELADPEPLRVVAGLCRRRRLRARSARSVRSAAASLSSWSARCCSRAAISAAATSSCWPPRRCGPGRPPPLRLLILTGAARRRAGADPDLAARRLSRAPARERSSARRLRGDEPAGDAGALRHRDRRPPR